MCVSGGPRLQVVPGLSWSQASGGPKPLVVPGSRWSQVPGGGPRLMFKDFLKSGSLSPPRSGVTSGNNPIAAGEMAQWVKALDD